MGELTEEAEEAAPAASSEAEGAEAQAQAAPADPEVPAEQAAQADPETQEEQTAQADLQDPVNPAEAEEPGPEKSGRSYAAGLFKGLFLGVLLTILAFTLARGYVRIPFPGGRAITLFLPYYEKLHGSDSGKIDSVEINRKMQEIEKLIDASYLYDADPKMITDGIFTGMLYGLSEDRYAAYYSKETFENESKRLRGSYVGIGVTVRKDPMSGGVLIEALAVDGPAMEVGLQVGDVITEADGLDLVPLTLEEAITHITGPEGTTVVLTVERREGDFKVTVERRTITDTTVRARIVPDTNIGYLSITSFTNVTEEEFFEEMDELKENKNVDGVIVDLRNNGGGDMNVALRMIDSILKDDQKLEPEAQQVEEAWAAGLGDDAPKSGKTVLLGLENKDGKHNYYYAEDEWSTSLPIVVVVNGHSASASEIFAGVLMKYGYDVVGEKTFGKGIVQSLYTLGDQSAVKFTTEQYILPDGELIHGVGVEPTIPVEFVEFDGITSDQVNYASGEETDIAGDAQIRAAVEAIQSAKGE